MDALVAGNVDVVHAKLLLNELQDTFNMGRLRQPLAPHTLARLPGPASHTLHVQLGKDPVHADSGVAVYLQFGCLLYTSPSPRDVEESRMPSSA